MAYIEPTVETFKARYPEFSAVPNTLVNLVLNEAFVTVGDGWHEDDRAKAQSLLVAHSLAMEGEPQRSNALNSGGSSNPINVGPVVEMQDRDVRVKFANTLETTGRNSKLGDISQGYMQSHYGKEYYLLMCRNVDAVAVT